MSNSEKDIQKSIDSVDAHIKSYLDYIKQIQNDLANANDHLNNYLEQKRKLLNGIERT